MGNMSYCRFENTSKDLQDCVDNWESLNEESTDYEREGKEKIIELAREIIEMEDLNEN
jgi:hypothetical protein